MMTCAGVIQCYIAANEDWRRCHTVYIATNEDWRRCDEPVRDSCARGIETHVTLTLPVAAMLLVRASLSTGQLRGLGGGAGGPG